MRDVTTTDLSEFGKREMEKAGEILLKYASGDVTQRFEDEFWENDVTVMFNRQSGKVFLTNGDYQVAMENPHSDGKLDMWYWCPYCGHEGFIQEMGHEPEDVECTEYLEQIGYKQEAQ